MVKQRKKSNKKSAMVKGLKQMAQRPEKSMLQRLMKLVLSS
jgi:hypothetical protein